MTGACPLCKGPGSVKVTQANGDETIVPCYPACTSAEFTRVPNTKRVNYCGAKECLSAIKRAAAKKRWAG